MDRGVRRRSERARGRLDDEDEHPRLLALEGRGEERRPARHARRLEVGAVDRDELGAAPRLLELERAVEPGVVRAPPEDDRDPRAPHVGVLGRAGEVAREIHRDARSAREAGADLAHEAARLPPGEEHALERARVGDGAHVRAREPPRRRGERALCLVLEDDELRLLDHGRERVLGRERERDHGDPERERLRGLERLARERPSGRLGAAERSSKLVADARRDAGGGDGGLAEIAPRATGSQGEDHQHSEEAPRARARARARARSRASRKDGHGLGHGLGHEGCPVRRPHDDASRR